MKISIKIERRQSPPISFHVFVNHTLISIFNSEAMGLLVFLVVSYIVLTPFIRRLLV